MKEGERKEEGGVEEGGKKEERGRREEGPLHLSGLHIFVTISRKLELGQATFQRPTYSTFVTNQPLGGYK